jgi:hypothetical protein
VSGIPCSPRPESWPRVKKTLVPVLNERQQAVAIGCTIRPEGRGHTHSTTGIPKNEVNRIWITMTDEKIQKAIQDAGINEMITCPQAFAIAEKVKVSRKAVGEYCTKNRIKIRSCQLGCFK